MALIADGVKMYGGEDDLWYFRVGADKVGLLALNQATLQKTQTGYRVHIPNLSSTANPMFATRDKAIDFVNDYIRRYR